LYDGGTGVIEQGHTYFEPMGPPLQLLSQRSCLLGIGVKDYYYSF